MITHTIVRDPFVVMFCLMSYRLLLYCTVLCCVVLFITLLNTPEVIFLGLLFYGTLNTIH